ncbi:uncharacterized protein Z519_11391 [Cladophialophora bantiana CBS 173.52]|uniref:Phosphatidylethanolamine-binding protein n=1 Tax=Cladophialophora bantiana (strain ATCC 10958 / CBS 173.52 / CDC B-1940 / NIH 8579) TaxID=1442370 RepID=A0A0D2FM61_CLAB1|nr:uncharacterized protein Z519_11391 [Cladophialophora bantiana CBS 173.52]KIW87807.1 hypothetical protein Z519_11391 [Cladophialophora bantiana CBS 173.52]
MRCHPAFPLLLVISPALAIPPPDFGFPEAPNDTALSITYQNNGNSVVVTEAELFGVEITSKEPTVAVETSRFQSIFSYNGSYVLLMVDPDARYPQDPTARFILHWLQTDMTPGAQAADGTSQLINSTEPRAPYRNPSPPTNSSAHRYIFYAFFQHENFTFPSAFEGYSATNRTNFNLTLFLDESNLGRIPAAAMYFFVSNQTQIPQDFTEAAGGTYPGGNGDMITAGPGPSIAPATTPATGGASTTATGSASSTQSGVPETATTTGSAPSASATNGAVHKKVGTSVLLLACFIALSNVL